MTAARRSPGEIFAPLWRSPTLNTRARCTTLAVAGLVALAALPAPASASSTSTDTLALAAGSLSISNLTSASFSASITAGTLNTGLNSATWTDATGLGLGWNGTLALQSFIYQGTWSAASGSTALTSTASGAYTGTAGMA